MRIILGSMLLSALLVTGCTKKQDYLRINIVLDEFGYHPDEIQVPMGQKVRFVVTRTIEGECAEQIQFPDFGIKPTFIPLNEPLTFEVTPQQAGTFRFSCGMNMYKGTIAVRS